MKSQMFSSFLGGTISCLTVLSLLHSPTFGMETNNKPGNQEATTFSWNSPLHAETGYASANVSSQQEKRAPSNLATATVSSIEIEGNWDSFHPSISADGRYVAFDSYASNLVSGDTGMWDVFVYDRQNKLIERISIASTDIPGNLDSTNPSISADGRYVVFVSNASNLVYGDTNGFADVFVYDRQHRLTERVSVASSGLQTNGESSSYSSSPSISADGRFVTFDSDASNLVSGDTNGFTDVFVRDRQTGTTTRVSVSSSGTQGNGSSSGFSSSPFLSADGEYIAYESDASNLVSGDTNGVADIFVWSRPTGTTTRVSVSSNGTQGNGVSFYPSISSNGRFIAFNSTADNLVSGDTNGYTDVFIRDQQNGQTIRASVATGGNQANAVSSWYSSPPVISGDGRYVVFPSDASNLVNGDTNGIVDIFVRDLSAGITTRHSVDSNDSQANGRSASPSISADGQYVVFDSYASNLVNGDTNGYSDIFLYDRQTSNLTRVSVKTVQPPIFTDVPTSHPYYQDIEILYANGLTGGCSTSPLKFCPDQTMDRGQSAVFMLRGKFGSGFVPGPATHIFKDDWTKGTWAEPWAEAMWTRGLSAGCLASPRKYCPWDQMPREQAVIFALRMRYGTDYIPPAATGTLFADMTDASYWATPWAEQAYKDGLIPNCGTSGGKPKFCPKVLVSRGLGAYIIVRAKNLSMP
jgi:Tol biopolymer transport system component